MRVAVGGTVFLAAFLLFLVEPMAAKQLLPVLGGSSAVWVTCLVFFQAALLLGYGYAWWMTRLGHRRRRGLHVAMLAVALSALLMPVMNWHATGTFRMMTLRGSEAALHPVATIFLALGAPIGIPFVVLGATSPLLQALLARRTGGVVPYRLFALSNVGSLLALILYPTVVEPRLTLSEQWGAWLAGFLLFVGLSGWLVWWGSVRSESDVRTHGAPKFVKERRPDFPGKTGAEDGDDGASRSFDSGAHDGGPSAQDDDVDRVTSRRRWMWFLLPMGAAMQLSAVTSHLSQDIAAIPLLWILPLATYLVTFILAFELPGLYRRWVVGRFLVVMLVSLGYSLSKVDTRLPVGLAILLYLVELFLACWFCHAEVYRLRPASARESTVFYLLVAAGGVAGTFFVGILSPLIFRVNYDLAIAFMVTAMLATAVMWEVGWAQRLLWSTGSILLLTLVVLLHIELGRHALMSARNFYGALRVKEADFDDQDDQRAKNPDGNAFARTGPVRILMNGRVRHGMQMMESVDRRRIPTTYYGVDSGVGVALRNCCVGRAKNVGVIGLGAGTVAAYGEAGDRFTFYEINPLVEPVARNFFTYLRDSRAAVDVVDGDGRAMLSREAPQGFDVLVVDAFSGDAIPLHLLTREAMEGYRRQLARGGLMAFHVSNSYLNLAPVIARLADAEGMTAKVVESDEIPAEGAYRATWVLVSGDAAFFARPGVAGVAMEIQRQPGLRVWTDDYSSLLPVLRLGR